MKQLILIVCTALALSAGAQSKRVRLTAEPLTIDHFHFNKITVVDTRLDTNVLGWVTKGINSILVPAVFESGAAEKLTAFYEQLTGHLWAGGKHELVIHVTDLFMAEDPDMVGTVGNMDIRMQAFLRQGDKYYSIHKLDKQEPFQAYDVTQKMFKTLNNYLIDFIKTTNEKFNDDLGHKTTYAWEDVLNIRQKEIIEKYALYKNSVLKDGIYETQMELFAQTPAWAIDELETKIKENLDKPKRKRQSMYAYCKNGELHIFISNSKYETVKLYRRDNNFYKQEYGLDPKLQERSAAMGQAFGLLASVIADQAQNGSSSWYEFVLNPRNGLFYHYKKLATTKKQYEAANIKPEDSTSNTASGTNR